MNPSELANDLAYKYVDLLLGCDNRHLMIQYLRMLVDDAISETVAELVPGAKEILR
jgi:hypothetical protein